MRYILSLGMVIWAATAWLPVVAKAQVTEEAWRFMQEIVEASNSISQETAREGYDTCKALDKKLAEMAGIDPIQKLYFEAEISHCIFYAMNNGNFSDAMGDQCSYHLQSAAKLAEVIRQAAAKPGYRGEMMGEVGNRLENSLTMGPSMGCKGDYEAFRADITEAKRLAALPPPPDPMTFLDEVLAIQSELKPETARDVQAKCGGLSAKIIEGTPPAQRLYFEALIENCSAMAKAAGSYSDGTGDVCDNHFRYASKLAEGLAASRTDVSAQMMLVPMMEGELEMAKLQGPEMGCKQDYNALKRE